jgi:hypothetical protein
MGAATKKVNKILNDGIHRPHVPLSQKNKTTAPTKNPQKQLNKNSSLIPGTHTTFHDYNIL